MGESLRQLEHGFFVSRKEVHRFRELPHSGRLQATMHPRQRGNRAQALRGPDRDNKRFKMESFDARLKPVPLVHRPEQRASKIVPSVGRMLQHVHTSTLNRGVKPGTPLRAWRSPPPPDLSADPSFSATWTGLQFERADEGGRRPSPQRLDALERAMGGKK